MAERHGVHVQMIPTTTTDKAVRFVAYLEAAKGIVALTEKQRFQPAGRRFSAGNAALFYIGQPTWSP
jgi:hypothetical protein